MANEKCNYNLYNHERRPTVITNIQEWNGAYSKFINDLDVVKVVGFDCEWVCSGDKRNPVALIQIANSQGSVVLIRIHLLVSDLPQTLNTFLSDHRILKVGVGIAEDASHLLKDYGLTVAGCVDLGNVVVRVPYYECRSSLKGLTEEVLHKVLEKNHSVQCSNWEASVLSDSQVKYATNDAQVAIDIFMKLVSTKFLRCEPSGEEVISDEDLVQTINTCVKGLVDISQKVNKSKKQLLVNNSTANGQKTKCKPIKIPVRQKVMYDNCVLLSPDSQVLSTIQRSKAEWYLQKHLADKVADDPLTVQLRFEPAGRPNGENFYTQMKANVCVVCGAGDTYLCKMIVPKEYRKYFPTCMKSHMSHDALLMCPQCHIISNKHDRGLRSRLAERCSAPFKHGSTQSRVLEIAEKKKVRSAARALYFHRDKLPVDRAEQLALDIKSFYGVFNDDILYHATDLDIRVANPDYSPHGELVVKYYREHSSLDSLVFLWRQHFIDTMKPQFLPEFWAVANETVTFGKHFTSHDLCDPEIESGEKIDKQMR